MSSVHGVCRRVSIAEFEQAEIYSEDAYCMASNDCEETKFVACSNCEEAVCRTHARVAHKKLFCLPCARAGYFCPVCNDNVMIDEVHDMCYKCAWKEQGHCTSCMNNTMVEEGREMCHGCEVNAN
jgi:hypothetical protein